MNKYSIEILADAPPRVFIGDSLAGGQVVAIKSNEPEFVSAKWLSEKTGLSKPTIIDRLRSIAQGSGKFTYPRMTALSILQSGEIKKGRPRKN